MIVRIKKPSLKLRVNRTNIFLFCLITRFLISLSAVIAVYSLIFYFSSQPASVSSAVSSRVGGMLSVIPILNMLPIRKLAHFSLFATLGVSVLVCDMSRISLLNFLSNKFDYYSAVPAIILGFFLAILDEFHQLFVVGRSAQIFDVVIDMCGFSVTFLGIYYYLRWRSFRNEKGLCI